MMREKCKMRVRAMMREKCTEKSRHSMPGNGRKKTAEYREEQNIRRKDGT